MSRKKSTQVKQIQDQMLHLEELQSSVLMLAVYFKHDISPLIVERILQCGCES